MKGDTILIQKKSDDRNEYLFRREDNKLIIQGTHVLFILGDIEKDIYYLIDGKRTVDDIIKEISDSYNISPREITEDVKLFIRQLINNKLVQIER